MSIGPRRTAVLRRWEDLHVAAQLAVAAPILVVVLWVAHVVLLAQPLGRGLAYGVFWGLLATGVVVGASRSERARREARERGSGPRRPAP
jgi:hypothetical protein